MKHFKLFCLLGAAFYLLLAFLPGSIMGPHSGSVKSVLPPWVGHAISFADFLLFAFILYGAQKRSPIYWTLIPIMLLFDFASMLLPALWTLVSLSLPWLPFLFIIGFVAIGLAAFYAVVWRKQREYFTSRQLVGEP